MYTEGQNNRSHSEVKNYSSHSEVQNNRMYSEVKNYSSHTEVQSRHIMLHSEVQSQGKVRSHLEMQN